MRKLYENKKGISPIISTILMIVVVMVGMTILFAYVAVYAQNYQAGTGSSILESMTIEDVWITGPQTVQLTVYNTATAPNLGTRIDSTVVAIYVNNSALTTGTLSGINFDVLVSASDHVTLDGYLPIGGNWPAGFQSGNTYDFRVVTMRGSSFRTQYIDP
jgi:flagellin-like protein